MTSIDIIFLIDLQNGFAINGIPNARGGSLYVQGGENVGAPAAHLIERARNSILVASMDFHDDDIISDMTNHRGILRLHRNLAAERGIAVEKLPFTDIYLRRDSEGVYKAVGVVVGDAVFTPLTDARGYVTEVTDSRMIPLPSDLRQTLWTKHCVAGTDSALLVSEVLDTLPVALADRIYRHDRAPTLFAEDDATGNIFYVVRKGMRRDVDSNAIALENDKQSFTSAIAVFEEIALNLKAQGITHARISTGGLATNICAELSNDNVIDYFQPILAEHGITSETRFITDISAGVPISVPGGAFPDLDHALARMAKRGTAEITSDEIIRSSMDGRMLRARRWDHTYG